ncbi:MAG: hypothetical protein GY768_18285 [Planctomycetaceae bacterium]|nr:hypothetical protein [Planctomycetaceae bacterium]
MKTLLWIDRKERDLSSPYFCRFNITLVIGSVLREVMRHHGYVQIDHFPGDNAKRREPVALGVSFPRKDRRNVASKDLLKRRQASNSHVYA